MKRKIFISIIPNQPGAKTNLYFFIFLFLFLVILFGISLFLLIRLFSFSNNILIGKSDIKSLKIENKILKETKEKVQKRLVIAKRKAEELDKTAIRVEPLLDVQKLPQDNKLSFDNANMSTRLDSLLEIDTVNKTVFSLAFNKLKENKKLASSIPSIIPVDGWLVKGFGYINDLFTDKVRFHPGLTFSAMKGAPVYAAADGSIMRKGREGGLGLFIEINHGFGYITKYGHLQSVKVKAGEHVKRGDVIGYAGKTGRVTGPSLFYEVTKSGRKTDPLNFIFEDVETMRLKSNK